MKISFCSADGRSVSWLFWLFLLLHSSLLISCNPICQSLETSPVLPESISESPHLTCVLKYYEYAFSSLGKTTYFKGKATDVAPWYSAPLSEPSIPRTHMGEENHLMTLRCHPPPRPSHSQCDLQVHLYIGLHTSAHTLKEKFVNK